MSTKRDRLRKAEKLLRQGRLDGAIAEYVAMLEEEPRDWATTNALGDLYVRANQVDQAVGQFTRIAEHFWTDGFYPKAAALYKKILKFKPADEPSQLRLAEISAQQGLLRDAKAHMTAVADQRRARGDTNGANEIVVRLGDVDPNDFDMRRQAARVLVELGQVVEAIEALARLATSLSDKGKPEEAIAVLKSAVDLDPTNVASLAMLASTYLATGNLDAAREYLTPDIAGDDPGMLLAVAEMQLRGGQSDEGREVIRKVIAISPDAREHIHDLAASLSESDADAAFVCVDLLVDAATAAEDWDAAASLLQEFVTRVPDHVGALIRLVEIAVDGSLDELMVAAQVQLADAHLAAGHAAEASIIAEDLVVRDPTDQAYVDRYRKTLVAMGDPDPDGKITARLSGGGEDDLTDGLDDLGADFFDEPAPAPPPTPARPSPVASPAVAAQAESGALGGDADGGDGSRVVELSAKAIDLSSILGDELDLGESAPPPAGRTAPPGETSGGSMEIDLTSVLDDLTSAEDEPTPSPAPASSPSLDEVFSGMRAQATQVPPAEETSAQQYQLGLSYRQMGKTDEAIQALETAAKSPVYRFNSAVMLGRLYFDKNEGARAVDWLERAAESPAQSEEEHRALLYHLGVTLERLGETARALGVLMELQADVGDYRDVSQRVGRLSRAETGG